MIQTVVKRDGRVVGYNEEKIKAAIRKAMLATEAGEDESLIQRIADRIGARGKSQMSVEAIQDQVELELMKSPRKEVARAYINYRHKRNVARKAKTADVFQEIIKAQKNDITRENANMNADTPAGMMMKFASETTKPFVDDYLLSEEARVLPHQEPYLRAAPARPCARRGLHGRPRRVACGQAHRDGQRDCLHLDGNCTKRDARRTGHPGL